jgi:hypothetical protein
MVKIHEFHDPDNALCIDRKNTLGHSVHAMTAYRKNTFF